MDKGPDMAVVLGGEDEMDDMEPMGPMEDEGEELTAEQEMLAETLGYDEAQASALKQFIRSCKEEY